MKLLACSLAILCWAASASAEVIGPAAIDKENIFYVSTADQYNTGIWPPNMWHTIDVTNRIPAGTRWLVLSGIGGIIQPTLRLDGTTLPKSGWKIRSLTLTAASERVIGGQDQMAAYSCQVFLGQTVDGVRGPCLVVVPVKQHADGRRTFELAWRTTDGTQNPVNPLSPATYPYTHHFFWNINLSLQIR
jgi:hypothetical protein